MDGLLILIVAVLLVLDRIRGRKKKQEEIPDETPPTEEIPKADDRFDEIRDILRKSWGLDEETGKEADAPGGVYREAPRAKMPEPAQVKRKAPVPKLTEKDETIFSKKERQTAAIRWTEDDVKRWVVYNTVLGTPRSRAPWRPFEGRM